MINKKQIVCLLNESNKQKLRYKELYMHCTDLNSRKLYRDLYLKSLDIHNSRYHMLLLFGYDTVFDENGNIIEIKEI